MIREATTDDLKALTEMITQAGTEIPYYSKRELNQGKIASSIMILITGDEGIVLVYEQDGVIVGVIIAMIAEYWFSKELYATDLALYVLPEYRKGIKGYKLVKEFTRIAFERGAVEVASGITSDVDVERASRIFERLGYFNHGKLYSKYSEK